MWTKYKATFWNEAPMFRLLLPLIIGIVCYDRIESLDIIGVQLMCGLIICFVPLLLLSISSVKNKHLKYTQFGFAQIMLILIGFAYCFNVDQRNKPNYVGKYLSQSEAFLTEITATPQEKEHSTKLSIQLLKRINGDTISDVEGNAFVYIYKSNSSITLHQGDRIIIPNHWERISNAGNPFELDYVQFCKRKNIFYQQFLTVEQIKLWARNDQNSPLINAHDYCIAQLNHFVKDSSSLALLKAMLVGDESGIDPNLRQAYSDTGIIHVISISGAHVSFLFMLVAFLLRRIRNKKYQWIQFVISLSFIWFYVLMAGSSAPAIRAALMFSIVAVGNMLNRETNPLNQLFSAAFFMLLWNPMWLFSVGFQLSFIAILSLIIFYKPITAFWRPQQIVLKWLYNTAAASLAAEILVAPLVAYYFHGFPPLFLFANIIACIAMGLVLALGMCIIIFSKITLLAISIARITEWLCIGFHKCIYLLQSYNIERLKTIYFNSFSLVLLYIIIASLCLYVLKQRKAALWLTLSILLLFSVVRFMAEWESVHQKIFIVYNSNKECKSELLSGLYYSIISGGNTESYNTRSAHIGFGCTNNLATKKTELIVVSNKKVLLLDSNTRFNKNHPFPIDILVIKSALHSFSVSEIQCVFNPKQIVLANNQNKKNSSAWKVGCTESKIAFHDTKTDGAYILR
jgi:competence protein ComEC